MIDQGLDCYEFWGMKLYKGEKSSGSKARLLGLKIEIISVMTYSIQLTVPSDLQIHDSNMNGLGTSTMK